MGTKDYEVRNRDYSSGEYHYNGNNSYGNNQYSKNDNSNFIGIIFLIFCILSGGILVALYYDFEAHTSKKDLAESKSSEQPKSSPLVSNNSSEKSKIDNSSDISNNTSSDSNSEFYNKLMKKIQKTHLSRDNNKPFGKKKTPLEIQQEEERKKRFEAKRISIFGNVKDSKESSTQNTKKDTTESSYVKQDVKPVPFSPDVVQEETNTNTSVVEAKPETVSEEAKTNTVAVEIKSETVPEEAKTNTAAVETKPETVPEEAKTNTAAVETKSETVPEEAKTKSDEEWEDVYNYIKNGELINLFRLAKEGKNLAEMYYQNEPAVCIAVRYDRFEILKYLIHEFDCKNLANTENKRNALHYAVIYYNLDTVRYLLKNGFSANDQDIEGNTPLHYAVSNQLKECVSVLLVNGANPNILNNKKQNALHLAVKNDNTALVKLLLVKDANINQQDVDGNTPLHYFPLFSYDNKAMLDEFYKYEDKMDFTVNNKYGKTPRNVIQKDCFDYYEKQYKVQEIEDKSENKEKTDSSNKENKKEKIHLEKYLVFSEESCLLDAEIDFKQDNEYVLCPAGPVVIPFKPMMVRLFLAQVAIEKDHSLFLEKLLQKDFHPINEPEKFIDINTKVILSMVVYAAEKNSRKCVEVLINNGADIKMEAPKPKEKQKVLVEEGKTLLHCAAQYGDISLMKRVIDAGVPVDKKTASGKTPLYFAVKNNQYESAYILLENGADREDSLKSETKDEKMLKLLETGK